MYLNSCWTLNLSTFQPGTKPLEEKQSEKIMQKRKGATHRSFQRNRVLFDSSRLIVLKTFGRTAYYITGSFNSVVTSAICCGEESREFRIRAWKIEEIYKTQYSWRICCALALIYIPVKISLNNNHIAQSDSSHQHVF